MLQEVVTVITVKVLAAQRVRNKSRGGGKMRDFFAYFDLSISRFNVAFLT